MLSTSFKKPSLTPHISIGSPDLHARSSYTLPNTVLSFCLHADLSLDLKLDLLTSCSLASRTVPISTCQIIRKQPAQFAQGTWDLGLGRWSWVTASIFHPQGSWLFSQHSQSPFRTLCLPRDPRCPTPAGLSWGDSHFPSSLSLPTSSHNALSPYLTSSWRVVQKRNPQRVQITKMLPSRSVSNGNGKVVEIYDAFINLYAPFSSLRSFMTLTVWKLFCRMSFSSGLLLVSSWLCLERTFIARNTTEVMFLLLSGSLQETCNVGNYVTFCTYLGGHVFTRVGWWVSPCGAAPAQCGDCSEQINEKDCGLCPYWVGKEVMMASTLWLECRSLERRTSIMNALSLIEFSSSFFIIFFYFIWEYSWS